MAWYNALGIGRRIPLSESDTPPALTAAAAPVRRPESQFLQRTQAWQEEAWQFYDSCGEANYAVSWLGNQMSQVRLRAAKLRPGSDEPEVVDTGIAAEIVSAMSGGVGGQSQIMRSLAVQLQIPGDSYLVGEDVSGVENWTVRSVDEVRVQSGKYQTVADRIPSIEWRDLPPGSVPVRIWRPHERYRSLADSPMRSALPILRELELVNRHITAQYLSRLASAGVLVLPDEVTFPTREEFQDAEDPFMEEWLEVSAEAIRTPGTAASVVPIPIRIPGEYVEKVRFIDFTLKIDEKIIEKRQDAINRLATKMDIPTEVMTGLGKVNHWCVDDTTEILTQRGWLTQDQLQVGDVALTLDHVTGMSQWQPVKFVYRAPVVNEPMVTMERQTHSSLTTPNHRWPVLKERVEAGRRYLSREFVHSEDLDRSHRITTGAVCADTPDQPKYSDDLVELVAWTWTEGHTQNGRMSVAQSHTVNPVRVDRIRSVLTRLFGPGHTIWIPRSSAPAWRESIQRNDSSHGGPVTVFHLNKSASAVVLEHGGKRVSTDFVRSLTRAQLELFIDVSCQGDGWHYRAGRLDIWQKDPVALEAYELALILSGRPTSFRPSGDGWNCAPSQNRTTVQPMKSAEGSHAQETVLYTGTVWCPVTDNSTWLARRNGTVYYTGNTAWQLDEGSLKTHIAPVAEIICHSLTTGYLQPRLKASEVEDWNQWVFWYDMSELSVSPDNSTNAQAAYDRLEISGEAYRRETGFDESDKPSDEELVILGLKAILRNTPGAAPSALDALVGKKVLDPVTPAGATPVDTGSPAATGTGDGAPPPVKPGPPATKDNPQQEKAATQVRRGILQSRALHAVTLSAVRPAELLHPPICQESAYSCPYTHAAWGMKIPSMSSGTYECRLDPFGQITVGQPAPGLDTGGWISTTVFRSGKGKAYART